MRLLALPTLALALAACHKTAEQTPSGNQSANAAPQDIKGVHRSNHGRALPSAAFNDPHGRAMKLADFAGKPVLVNLWATWCAPCVKELPTLDELARKGSIEVVALSEDSASHASVVAFLEAHHISTLKPYQDPKMAVSAALGPDTVLPTSILVGADGREVWRYVGDLDWTSQEAARLLGEAGRRKES